MRDHPDRPSGSGGARALRWAEGLLVIAGAAMLVWCALLLADANLFQRAARRSLETAAGSDASADRQRPHATTAVPPRAPIILRGSAIAALSIPRVDLSVVVLHGSDAQTLRHGPGHLENTAWPGESGNVVIAGHRDSFFRPLRNIQLGDDVFVDTPQGRLHYRVTSLRVVNAHDLSVLEPSDTAVLTLITCYPFWVFGHAPDRFVVRAAGVVDPTAAALVTPPAPPHASILAPAVQAAAMSESENRTVRDDEALVRAAIERFRLTYNARLITHNDARPGGPLRFQTCDVTITDDRAVAACDASAQSPDEPQPRVSTFTLERTHVGWAIRSLAVP
jgi:sortase A